MKTSNSQGILTITRAAARWGCTIADIGGWAAAGRIRIVMGISPVTCGAHHMAGLVEVATADILPIFLREGRDEVVSYLHRVRPIDVEGDWYILTDPIEGIPVCLYDLAIQGHDAAHFEAEEGLVMVRAGGSLRYDWEQMAYGLVARAAKETSPKSQSELIRWAQDWFAVQGDIPDESTVRRRLTPLWREFQGQG